jgi:hypothetical protein
MEALFLLLPFDITSYKFISSALHLPTGWNLLEADRLRLGEAVIQHPSLLQPDIQVSCVPVSQN